MSKWHSLLEYLQFPLKLLFFATLMVGVGATIANPNLHLINEMEPNVLYYISNVLTFFGGTLISLFPFIVFVKVLSKRFVDTPPILIGIFSVVLMITIVMVLSKTDFPVYFYSNVFTSSYEYNEVATTSIIMKSPYNMGIIPLVIAYYITSFSYRRSRHHVRHGIFYFIDHDSWAILISMVLSIIAALALSFAWPVVITLLQQFIDYVASDILSPLSMFFYGIVERLSSLFNLSSIFHRVFWLSEAGGSWIDSSGVTYAGDASIWMATKDLSNVSVNAGQFVSAYYIINLFLIPAFLIGYYRLMGKKENKRKYLFFIIFACLVSIICGNPLPMELCMLVLSPLLYAIYLLIVGFSFALMSSLEVFIGFSYEGNLLSALPGNAVDLINYVQNPNFYQPIIVLLIAGLVIAIIFYLATIFYFKKLAIGLLSMHSAESVAHMVVEAVGGLSNIQDMDATPDKIIASFKSRDIVDLDRLKELGAYLILESRDGYYIRLGNISIMVCDHINALRKQQN